MNAIVEKALGYMQSLVTDGGPSLTRWLALRVTEAMTAIVAGMVVVECISVLRGHGSDAGIISAIVSIAIALIGATSLNQNTKLTLDAKLPANPSSVSTVGATVKDSGDHSDDNK